MSKRYSVNQTGIPKGRLVIISNAGPDVPDSPNHLFHLLSDQKNSRIEILMGIGAESGQVRKLYAAGLAAAGYTDFDFTGLSEMEASDEQVCNRILNAKTVIFTGSQPELCAQLKNSPLLKKLYRKYLLEEDFTIAGIDAGAAWLSGVYLNDSGIDQGLGLIGSCIIDTRFDCKVHFKKLIRTVISHKEYLGIGLSNGAALIIREGCKALCTGPGSVMLINAKDVRKDAVRKVEKGASLFVKNLKGHILMEGCMLNLMNGEVINTLQRDPVHSGNTDVQQDV